MKVAVLVSGRGTNLQALLEAIDQGMCQAEVAAVISDRASAAALELASARGIPTAVVRFADFAERADWDAQLADSIAAFEPALVVLAGFMRLVGKAVLGRFEGRIVNVHPSLLPAFPGADAPAQAVRGRVCLSGCTVHVVDAGVDTGPILAQAAVPVLHSDDAATLHARIQTAEHRLLPAVVHAIATGSIELGNPPRHVPASGQPVAAAYAWPPLLH